MKLTKEQETMSWVTESLLNHYPTQGELNIKKMYLTILKNQANTKQKCTTQEDEIKKRQKHTF